MLQDQVTIFHSMTLVDLRSLEGVYRNIGDADPKSIPANCPDCRLRLSMIIWPGDKMLDHSSIDAIEVRISKSDTLIVKALSFGKVITESLFIEGKDFTIRAGRIHIKTTVGLAAPVIGPGYQTIEIGLDSEGNGKYRDSSGAAGLVGFLIPIGVVGTEDVRFPRISN